VDDPDDEACIDAAGEMCQDLYVARLNPLMAKLCGLAGALTQQALSLRYCKDAQLHAWVQQTLVSQTIDATVVFLSVIAQFLEDTLAAAIGQRGRQRVIKSYSWTAHLASIVRQLDAKQPARENA
jgi:hypothetical protein